jgi:hypothetical protein
LKPGPTLKRKSQTLAQETVPAYNIMPLIQIENAPEKEIHHLASNGRSKSPLSGMDTVLKF